MSTRKVTFRHPNLGVVVVRELSRAGDEAADPTEEIVEGDDE